MYFTNRFRDITVTSRTLVNYRVAEGNAAPWEYHAAHSKLICSHISSKHCAPAPDVLGTTDPGRPGARQPRAQRINWAQDISGIAVYKGTNLKRQAPRSSHQLLT